GRLSNVDKRGAGREQPFEFGVLVAVGGVDVDVQPQFAGLGLVGVLEHECRLRAAEPGLRRPNFNTAVDPVQFDVSEYLAPEPREPVWIAAVQYEFGDAAGHSGTIPMSGPPRRWPVRFDPWPTAFRQRCGWSPARREPANPRSP